MKNLCMIAVLSIWLAVPSFADEPLRIIAFGAHPDDCEIMAGGVAAKWAKLGHKVKFVAVTNGDIGHSVIAGGPLFQRRLSEMQDADKVLGVETCVLDNHDGELMPTLENRKKIIRLIREWQADVVITHRPNDYHPDHRYTSILVQDAAFMVTVPFITADIPHMKKNPVFVYSQDRFQKPYPFEHDIVVSIDDVYDQKMKALGKLVSQFFEYGAAGDGDPASFFHGSPQEQLQFLQRRFNRRMLVNDKKREGLAKYYGSDKAANVKYAESFEICEYGSQPSIEEIKRLFPFFP